MAVCSTKKKKITKGPDGLMDIHDNYLFNYPSSYYIDSEGDYQEFKK